MRLPLLRAAALTLPFCVPVPAIAQDGGGFAELRWSLYPGAEGKVWQTVERVRPSFETEIIDRVAMVGTVEAGLHQGRDTSTVVRRLLAKSDLGPLLRAADCTWQEHTNTHLGIDRASDYLEVSRLYLDIYSAHIDLRIGRQALNWGSAQFLNPTDPFPEVLFAEPWRPRRGVNAVRAIVPFGDLNDLAAVVAANDAFTEARAAARLRVNWLATDFALVGAWRSDNDTGLLGLDLRGTLGVGWWLEGALNIGVSDPYEAITAGIDYSFPVLENLIVFGQYHRNGAGATHPDDYDRALSLGGIAGPSCADGSLPLDAGAKEPDPFAPFVQARDYLMAGANLAIDEYLSASLFALQNLNDGTAIVVPTATYVALDWLEVALSAQVPVATWGSGGELKPRATDLQLQDPFGIYGVDLSGMVPAATVTVWTRASF